MPEFLNFEVFDVFCHWMCDESLGYYAIDNEKYQEWLAGPIKVPHTNELRIWKIAPGSHDKRRQMWPVFEERGYIGVGSFFM